MLPGPLSRAAGTFVLRGENDRRIGSAGAPEDGWLRSNCAGTAIARDAATFSAE